MAKETQSFATQKMAGSFSRPIFCLKGNWATRGLDVKFRYKRFACGENVFQRSGLKRLRFLGVKVESWSHIASGHGEKAPPGFAR